MFHQRQVINRLILENCLPYEDHFDYEFKMTQENWEHSEHLMIWTKYCDSVKLVSRLTGTLCLKLNEDGREKYGCRFKFMFIPTHLINKPIKIVLEHIRTNPDDFRKQIYIMKDSRIYKYGNAGAAFVRYDFLIKNFMGVIDFVTFDGESYLILESHIYADRYKNVIDSINKLDVFVQKVEGFKNIFSRSNMDMINFVRNNNPYDCAPTLPRLEMDTDVADNKDDIISFLEIIGHFCPQLRIKLGYKYPHHFINRYPNTFSQNDSKIRVFFKMKPEIGTIYVDTPEQYYDGIEYIPPAY